MSQNLFRLRLQKYGFFRNRQSFSENFFQIFCNCLIINIKTILLCMEFPLRGMENSRNFIFGDP